MTKSPYDKFKKKTEVKTSETAIIDYDDFQFTIKQAGSNNIEFLNAVELLKRKYEPLLKRFEIKQPDIEGKQALLKRYEEDLKHEFVNHVLVSWEGMLDEKGKPLPFTHKNAYRLFNDLPDLFDDLALQAAEQANFIIESDKEEEKNLPAS